MKTDMPQKIYIDCINNDGVGTAFHPKPHSKICHTEEYTRSDLCVPRSEYDKLKQQAEKMAKALRFYERHASNNSLCADCGCPTKFKAKEALAEYRKETE